MKFFIRWFGITLLSVYLFSCEKDPMITEPSAEAQLVESLLKAPDGFPEIPFPEENPFSIEKWKLGKRLFFDPVLSRDRSISCASCHQPSLAFADDVAVSPGVENKLGERNSPSLANVAYLPYYTREGGVPTLEMQILVPIQEHAEFDFDILQIAERLLEDSNYVSMSQAAFERAPDAYVITRALSTFERTLISGASDYDMHLEGSAALSPVARSGMELFFSDKTSCSSCHAGFNFTNNAFENNGLYSEYPHVGRYRLTLDSVDLARFKVPSLRNAGLTAPYMHDGSLSTLQEVVEHYNNGGENHFNKSTLIRPLGLTQTEVGALVSFLESLTDPSFTQNKLFHEDE